MRQSSQFTVALLRRIREFLERTQPPLALGEIKLHLEGLASVTEELSAPYDASAKFRFFVGTSLTAQDAPPSDLSTVRGVEMNMTGMSERIPSGETQKKKAPFITAVFFKNRLN